MIVVVMVLVKREHALRFRAEHRAIGGRCTHILRRALATDMPVQADHAIGGPHHHQKIVADHQDRNARLGAHILDQLVESDHPRLIEPLRRLVEHQKLRIVEQCPRQQNPLELAARQRGKLPVLEPRNARPRQHRLRLRRIDAIRQRQEAPDGHRHVALDMESLRHIADPQPRAMRDLAARGREMAQQRAHEGRFPRPVRPDHRHDFAGPDRERDIVQNRRGVALRTHRKTAGRDQGLPPALPYGLPRALVRRGCGRRQARALQCTHASPVPAVAACSLAASAAQTEQRPKASTVARST